MMLRRVTVTSGGCVASAKDGAARAAHVVSNIVRRKYLGLVIALLTFSVLIVIRPIKHVDAYNNMLAG